MPGACEQCVALERQLSETKDAIAAEIRRGHKHRSDTTSDRGRRSLGELLASLEKAQAIYDRHRQDCHNASL